MRILLIHQNFPGQFRQLGTYLTTQKSVQVLGVGVETNVKAKAQIPGLKVLTYANRPTDPNCKTHHYLRDFERAVRRGQDVARLCIRLRQKGFVPDLVVAHPSWGESLFIKDVFPAARLVNYFEYFFQARGGDVGFDPEFPPTEDGMLRLRIRNSVNLQAMASCDLGISPTQWQRSRYPAHMGPPIEVIHEGFNIAQYAPRPDARFTLPDGRVLTRANKVLTFVSRNLEPYRGFHTVMRAMPRLLALDPDLQVVMVGKSGVSYGSLPKGPHKSWREKMLAEVPLTDPRRVHFMGHLPYDAFLDLLQISTVHLYLTYPFVLSWSLLEALASGCAVLASDTAPVTEFIRHEDNGLLFPFFDQDALVAGVQRTLKEDMRAMRQRAAAGVAATLDFKEHILPRLQKLLGLP